MKKWIVPTLAAAAFVFTAAGEAKAGGILGLLTCSKTGAGQTYVIFSKAPVSCTYEGVGGTSKYTGTAGIGLGVDLQYEQDQVVSYLVMGGAGNTAPLAGTYVGAKASATFGIGPTVQGGLAGAGNGFSLVPIGLGGQTGFGAAGGISYLNIQ
ncbi:MAG: DUF992 domain-containing protein [Actinomycetota bacterium]